MKSLHQIPNIRDDYDKKWKDISSILKDFSADFNSTITGGTFTTRWTYTDWDNYSTTDAQYLPTIRISTTTG